MFLELSLSVIFEATLTTFAIVFTWSISTFHKGFRPILVLFPQVAINQRLRAPMPIWANLLTIDRDIRHCNLTAYTSRHHSYFHFQGSHTSRNIIIALKI